MKRALLLCLLLGAPLAGFAQTAAPAPLTGKLLITGSSTMAPLVDDLAKRFQKLHPGVAITVESGGSGRGVADARDGGAGMGLALAQRLAELHGGTLDVESEAGKGSTFTLRLPTGMKS